MYDNAVHLLRRLAMGALSISDFLREALVMTVPSGGLPGATGDDDDDAS